MEDMEINLDAIMNSNLNTPTVPNNDVSALNAMDGASEPVSDEKTVIVPSIDETMPEENVGIDNVMTKSVDDKSVTDVSD